METKIVNEEWKSVVGWSLYEISNMGKIRSKDRVINTKKYSYVKKGRILNPIQDEFGYYRVVLKQDGRSKAERIHRLVCEAFIANPLNKPCVNHIDNNPTNNRVDNLEWVTHQENTDWMIKQGRFKRNQKWLDKLHKTQRERFYKKVRGTNLQTGETIEYECVNRTKVGGFSPSSVSECCNGKIKSYKGYKWEFV